MQTPRMLAPDNSAQAAGRSGNHRWPGRWWQAILTCSSVEILSLPSHQQHRASMTPRLILVTAAISGLFSVLLGAFGAHGLNDTKYLERKYAETPPKIVAGMSVPASFKYFRDFETGVDYQLTHTVALLVCGLLMQQRCTRALRLSATSFSAGIVLFSGSLYVLVIGGPRLLGVPWGMVAPVGGTLLMVGWVSLAIHCAGLWRVRPEFPE